MIQSPTEEELDIVTKGNEFREFKNSSGYKRLIQHLIQYVNNRLDVLQNNSDATLDLRLLDQWRACERMYSDIITEIDGSIKQLEDKERELRELGIMFPELHKPIT